ncbi:hypothetical protein BDZ89DRAFT_1049572 [Hymenopellis radicata]|nr:hypothetical protein BDZ89DRAFT_1049572 [Hymenopellis radicata]
MSSDSADDGVVASAAATTPSTRLSIHAQPFLPPTSNSIVIYPDESSDGEFEQEDIPDDFGSASLNAFNISTQQSVAYPPQYVQDPAIPDHAWQDATYPYRVGVAFTKVPELPLQPTPIPLRSDDKKVNFYPTLVGRTVGIFLDPEQARTSISGVPNGSSCKRGSLSLALEYFNDALATGRVAIGVPREYRAEIVITVSRTTVSWLLVAFAVGGRTCPFLSTTIMSSSTVPPSSLVSFATAESDDDSSVIVLTSDDDGNASPRLASASIYLDDDLAEALASMSLRSPTDRTLYRINSPTKTPSYTADWSKAHESQSQDGAQVKAVQKRVRRMRAEPACYVVFVGTRTGLYTRWAACAKYVQGQTHSISLGFRTVSGGQEALEFAMTKSWVQPSSQVARRQFARVGLHTATSADEYLAPNPIHTHATSQGYFVVYVGTHPGIYNNYVQAIHCVLGVPSGSQESFESLATARAAWRSAMAAHRVVKWKLLLKDITFKLVCLLEEYTYGSTGSDKTVTPGVWVLDVVHCKSTPSARPVGEIVVNMSHKLGIQPLESPTQIARIHCFWQASPELDWYSTEKLFHGTLLYAQDEKFDRLGESDSREHEVSITSNPLKRFFFMNKLINAEIGPPIFPRLLIWACGHLCHSGVVGEHVVAVPRKRDLTLAARPHWVMFRNPPTRINDELRALYIDGERLPISRAGYFYDRRQRIRLPPLKASPKSLRPIAASSPRRLRLRVDGYIANIANGYRNFLIYTDCLAGQTWTQLLIHGALKAAEGCFRLLEEARFDLASLLFFIDSIMDDLRALAHKRSGFMKDLRDEEARVQPLRDVFTWVDDVIKQGGTNDAEFCARLRGLVGDGKLQYQEDSKHTL